MKILHVIIITGLLSSCVEKPSDHSRLNEGSSDTVMITDDHLIVQALDEISLVVLGTCQDGGSPHTGCSKACCAKLFNRPDPNRMVVSLGVVDPHKKRNFLFEATPDFPRQMELLNRYSGLDGSHSPDGIFLTHAHIGHYTGLMYLGKEAMNATSIPVHVMPRMHKFLINNGPWSQLVRDENISLNRIDSKTATSTAGTCDVKAIPVPHRDEYSETVGFYITGPSKEAVFIPDIDKWEKWNQAITDLIRKVDYAFLDATFYDHNELDNRDMSEIPHPFVVESMELFRQLPAEDRAKIYFIHLNHTNPLLDTTSVAYRKVIDNGFNVAQSGDVFPL